MCLTREQELAEPKAQLAIVQTRQRAITREITKLEAREARPCARPTVSPGRPTSVPGGRA